jgi:hypothetical protein
VQTKDFANVLDQQIQKCREVLVGKAEEYATDTDRLHNFKVAADIRGCSVTQAVAGMMVKHTVSIYDMCESDKTFDLELWTEKITDNLNYLLLLKAAVVEGTWDEMGVLPYFHTTEAPRPTSHVSVKTDGSIHFNADI